MYHPGITTISISLLSFNLQASIPITSKPEPTLEQNLISGNIAISEWFDGVAEGLDFFFVGKVVSARPNKSSFKIENDIIYTENGATAGILSLTLADYGEKTHLYDVTNGISFGQFLNPKSALSYNLVFSFSNRPNYHLDSYNFSVAYGRIIYKRVLDCQVTPNLEFKRERSFTGLAGLSINLTLTF